MKIRSIILIGLAGILVFASCASFDASQFPKWVEEEGIWRSVSNQSFKKGAQNAPTEAQIKNIIDLAVKTPVSGGANDWFLLVLKDVAQQQDVVGKDNAHDGTVTIMVFTDRVLEKHPRNVPFAPDRGYVSAGTACGYINLGAISQGLGTHFYLTPAGYYINRPYIPAYTATTAKPAIEDVYLKGKGYQYFIDGDYAANPTGNPNGAFYDHYGALKFVLAVVIGNLDTTADTTVTTKKYHPNVVFAK